MGKIKKAVASAGMAVALLGTSFGASPSADSWWVLTCVEWHYEWVGADPINNPNNPYGAYQWVCDRWEYQWWN